MLAGVLAAITLAACGDNANNAGKTDAPAPAASSAITNLVWEAEPPSTVTAGATTELNLSGQSMAWALYPDTAVGVGDVLNAHFVVTGPAGRQLDVILHRACDTQNGEGADHQQFTLTGGADAGDIRLPFNASFSCVRVSFRSVDGQPLPVSVVGLELTRAE